MSGENVLSYVNCTYIKKRFEIGVPTEWFQLRYFIRCKRNMIIRNRPKEGNRVTFRIPMGYSVFNGRKKKSIGFRRRGKKLSRFLTLLRHGPRGFIIYADRSSSRARVWLCLWRKPVSRHRRFSFGSLTFSRKKKKKKIKIA